MVPRSPAEKGVPRSGGEKSLDTQFKIVAEAFLESFELLEEYAPIWYTEQHHQSALSALANLGKVQGDSVKRNDLSERQLWTGVTSLPFVGFRLASSGQF